MRLTKLEIFGFKSFAQKVQIPFGPGITAIVGPNGCGKSNVVESIRWVLGEQRAGSFRSHRMEDVIFAGTRARKALGLAEVTLTIDNADNSLPIDFTEVTLTRRLVRSGDGDYLLNRIPCRLLDITNLLMDTGLGQGAYAVMEQGMVDEIVSEKTENRRRILEEAAGITKYKARRRATWSRLEATEADLLPIEATIAELKRTVDYLSRQVGRARRYQELKRELDALEVFLGRRRFAALGDQVRPLQEEVGALVAASEQGYARFTALEAELERVRLGETGAEKALQEVGGRLSGLIDQIHELDRQLVAAGERLEATAAAIARASSQRQEHAAQLALTQREGEETVQARSRAEGELARVNEDLENHENQAEQAEEAYAGGRQALDELQHSRLARMREQGEVEAQLERLRAASEGVEERLRSLAQETERRRAEQEAASQEAAQAGAAGEEVRRRREQEEERLQRLQDTVQAVQARVQLLQERRHEARRAIEASQARLQVMRRVRSGFEGYSRGVRYLMLESPQAGALQGVLGDLIDVDPRYVRAVEAALGEALEALVADGEEPIAAAIQRLKEHAAGRAGLFSLGAALPPSPPEVEPGDAPGIIGPVLDYVRADGAVAPLVRLLLHNTYLVEDLATALRLRRADTQLCCVTADGEAIDLHGRVSGGQSRGEDTSVLGRRQEIRGLEALLARQRAMLHACECSLRVEETRSGVLAGRLLRLSGRVARWREQERELAHRQQSSMREAERLGAGLAQHGEESTRLLQRHREHEAAVKAGEDRLQQARQRLLQVEAATRQAEERLQRAEALRRDRLDQLAALRVERAHIAETAHSRAKDSERLQHIARSLQESVLRLDGEMEAATASRQEMQARALGLESELAERHEAREALAAERDRRQVLWAEANVRSRQLEETISRLQRELSGVRERQHRLELQAAELTGQAEHVRQRLQEEQGVDVAALGPPAEEVDVAAAESRLAELRASLQRLGAVHLGVLEEYDQQKQRYEFYSDHRDDLVAAAEDMRRTLRLIDRTARRMFADTFEQIRQKFRETFVRFFPGGEADLRLQEEADPLEAEIDIIARPRGKRLQSISLLSGGERALTAISLLFAIYLVKPSPFCILDEVDAPLDDANIGRFVRVLREFARSTQFIMVTHNKISMAAADTLHGVTMPEEGVSQLVSVRLEDYELEEAAG
ncbi:MAG: chromosome segregation protein SMC [Candidatus Latescibacterota bacterium]